MKKQFFLAALMILCIVCTAACADPIITDTEATAWIAENNYLYLQNAEGRISQMPLEMSDLLQMTKDELICQTKDGRTIAVKKDGTGSRTVDQTAELPQDTRVELSAEVDSGKMHILGYGIDPDNNEFNIVMKMLREARAERNKNIIEALKCLFKIEISLDDVKKYAKGDTVGKPHIAAAIVEKGYCSDIETVFKKILGKKCLDGIERKKLPPRTCIELINKAGGIAFLAHPNSLKLTNEKTFAKIKELQRYGLVGIEAYHSSLSQAQNNTYVKMAKELGLMISCGSDFHGPEVKKDVKLGTGINGNLPTYNEEIIAPLLKALNM